MQYESCSVAGKIAAGTCKGNWESGNESCVRCQISKSCEDITKQELLAPLPKTNKSDRELPPMDHMLDLLESRYGSRGMTENDEAEKMTFSDASGIVQFVIIRSKVTGKLKFSSRKRTLVINTLKSVKHARDILDKLL